MKTGVNVYVVGEGDPKPAVSNWPDGYSVWPADQD